MLHHMHDWEFAETPMQFDTVFVWSFSFLLLLECPASFWVYKNVSDAYILCLDTTAYGIQCYHWFSACCTEITLTCCVCKDGNTHVGAEDADEAEEVDIGILILFIHYFSSIWNNFSVLLVIQLHRTVCFSSAWLLISDNAYDITTISRTNWHRSGFSLRCSSQTNYCRLRMSECVSKS